MSGPPPPCGARVCSNMKHPKIVSVLGVSEDPDDKSLLLVIEYCNSGNLFQ